MVHFDSNRHATVSRDDSDRLRRPVRVPGNPLAGTCRAVDVTSDWERMVVVAAAAVAAVVVPVVVVHRCCLL